MRYFTFNNIDLAIAIGLKYKFTILDHTEGKSLQTFLDFIRTN